MNYKKHYDTLIESAKRRKLYNVYTENHHIIPKCLGGTNKNINLVKLTPEEHYVAHQLLIKIYPDNTNLINAAMMMTVGRTTNKIYGWLRRKFSEKQKINQSGKNNTQYGTCWIYNTSLKQSKKISKTDPLPDGWCYGRKIKFDEPTVKESQKIKSKETKKKNTIKNQKQYNYWYEVYKIHGWDEFVDVTGYKYSQVNFVRMCNKYVINFISQNGKQRGK